MVMWVPQTPGLSMLRGCFRNPPEGSSGLTQAHRVTTIATTSQTAAFPPGGSWREVEATLTSRAGTRGCRFGLLELLLVAASCHARSGRPESSPSPGKAWGVAI